MRGRCWFPLLVAALVAGGAGLPAALAGGERAGRVAVLVEQLGSEKFAERQAATTELEALGAPALEALRQAAQGKDPEVRRRAQTLVRQIEKGLETERLLEPTRVRLAYRETPLAEAVADLARQGGITIKLLAEDTRAGGRRV